MSSYQSTTEIEFNQLALIKRRTAFCTPHACNMHEWFGTNCYTRLVQRITSQRRQINFRSSPRSRIQRDWKCSLYYTKFKAENFVYSILELLIQVNLSASGREDWKFRDFLQLVSPILFTTNHQKTLSNVWLSLTKWSPHMNTQIRQQILSWYLYETLCQKFLQKIKAVWQIPLGLLWFNFWHMNFPWRS